MIEFLAMGGHAPYIWGSYGVALVVMVAELALLRRRRKTLSLRLQRLARLGQEDRGDSTQDT
ncbi:heme exporter protein D [Ectothiorhodospira magna]|uniref:Heme exporter protein D n=1 Tax=Ectothiorhodospira magna TaxID=867345 RepID=A0A1H9CLM2_9GAMM|nr:heme exporter protein CcmD [Ectothiorhodospira magna]SEQ02116.1 heme exporter protein D [Ectothiorhodospira magna]